MSKPRQRACLENGLKLDLNKLTRQGFVRPGASVVPYRNCWFSTYWNEELAAGLISANMEGEYEGWFRIQIGNLDQTIILVPKPRHFGGRQWYFLCPVMNRCASVLWKPPGASRFCSRQAWGQRVAYASQFLERRQSRSSRQSENQAALNRQVSTLMNGSCRRSPSGCDGEPTSVG